MITFLILTATILPVIYNHEVNKEHIEHAPHQAIKQPHYFPDGTHNVQYHHEAIWGTQKSEGEGKPLDPAEAQVKLTTLVEKMDANKDGFIDKKELVDWVYQSLRMLDDEEALDRMEDHDGDEDGNVTWSEYLDKSYGYLPDEVEDFREDQNKQVKAIGEMIHLDQQKFVAADVDQNGKLDKTEYPAFMHPYDYDHMHEVEIKRILHDYDRNADGVIDLPEYMLDEDFPFEKKDKEQEIVDKENFKAFDFNKNGVLDPKEIKAWALPNHHEAAADQATHLIKETDNNGDKKLSLQEIKDHYQLWIGNLMNYDSHEHEHGEL